MTQSAASNSGLRYDGAYHLHCMITLDSGRVISLRRLDQSQTYWGLQIGCPNAESNEWRISHLVRRAKDACDFGEPFLIAPRRRDFCRVPGDSEQARRRGRIPEWLPMVECMGVFTSLPPARDASKHLSCLTVLWFQDEFSPPLDSTILKEIQSMDWDELATDCEL